MKRLIIFLLVLLSTIALNATVYRVPANYDTTQTKDLQPDVDGTRKVGSSAKSYGSGYINHVYGTADNSDSLGNLWAQAYSQIGTRYYVSRGFTQTQQQFTSPQTALDSALARGVRSIVIEILDDTLADSEIFIDSFFDYVTIVGSQTKETTPVNIRYVSSRGVTTPNILYFHNLNIDTLRHDWETSTYKDTVKLYNCNINYLRGDTVVSTGSNTNLFHLYGSRLKTLGKGTKTLAYYSRIGNIDTCSGGQNVSTLWTYSGTIIDTLNTTINYNYAQNTYINLVKYTADSTLTIDTIYNSTINSVQSNLTISLSNGVDITEGGSNVLTCVANGTDLYINGFSNLQGTLYNSFITSCDTAAITTYNCDIVGGSYYYGCDITGGSVKTSQMILVSPVFRNVGMTVDYTFYVQGTGHFENCRMVGFYPTNSTQGTITLDGADSAYIYNSDISVETGSAALCLRDSAYMYIQGSRITAEGQSRWCVDGGGTGGGYPILESVGNTYVSWAYQNSMDGAFMVDYGMKLISKGDRISSRSTGITIWRESTRAGTTEPFDTVPSSIELYGTTVYAESLYAIYCMTGDMKLRDCEITSSSQTVPAIYIKYPLITDGDLSVFTDTVQIHNTTIASTYKYPINISVIGVENSKNKWVSLMRSTFHGNDDENSPIYFNAEAQDSIHFIVDDRNIFYTDSLFDTTDVEQVGERLEYVTSPFGIQSDHNYIKLLMTDSIDGDYWDTTTAIARRIDAPLYSGFVTHSGYTDNGDGTITLPAETVALYDNPDHIGRPKKYYISDTTLTPTDGAKSYIVADYNSGSPRYEMRLATELDSINTADDVPYITVYRNGTCIHSISWDEPSRGMGEKIFLRMAHTDRFVREKGLELSADSLIFYIDSGVVWNGVTRVAHEYIKSDSSNAHVTWIYHVSGNWVSDTSATGWNNRLYDNGTDTVAVSNNNYVVNWVYRIQSEDPAAVILFGTENYAKLFDAQNSQPPASVPDVVAALGFLVGRIITEKDDTVGLVESAFELAFNPTTILHNELDGLQGGTTNQYYHLSALDYTAINGINAVLYVSNDSLYAVTNSVWDLSGLSSIIFPSGDYMFDVIKPTRTDTFGYVGTSAYPYQRSYIDTNTMGHMTSGNDTVWFDNGYFMNLNKIETDTIEIRGSLFKYVSGTDSIYTNGDDLFTTGSINVADSLIVTGYISGPDKIILDSLRVLYNIYAGSGAESLYWDASTGDGIVTGDWSVRDTNRVYGQYIGYGSTSTDLPTYGAEELSDANWTSTGWTGSWSTGWTHTAGNTTALTNTLAAVNATKYQIGYTITGRTAGTINISFGGVSTGAVSATGSFGPTTSSTATLSIAPTTDFDGTLVLSIKKITAVSTPMLVLKSTGDSAKYEIRGNITNGNTFAGVSAGAYNTTGYANTANGYYALRLNTTGYHNTANGYYALYSNTTGNQNTANGYYALYSNTTGYYNTANGYYALYSNTTGYHNTANGYAALYSNTSGTYNTANGSYALNSNTTGAYNTANGVYALRLNTTGAYNTAYGSNALRSNTTGQYNTAYGYNAGYYISDSTTANATGKKNVFIGGYTMPKADGDSNEIVIGYNSRGIGTNTSVLGNSLTDSFLLWGNGRFEDDIKIDSSLTIGGSISAIASAESLYWNSATGDGIVTGDWRVKDTLVVGNNKIYDNGTYIYTEGFQGYEIYGSELIRAYRFTNNSTAALRIHYNYGTNPLIRWYIGNYDNTADTSMVEDSLNGIRIYRDLTLKKDLLIDSSLTIGGSLLGSFGHFTDSLNVGATIKLKSSSIEFSDSIYLFDGTGKLWISPTLAGLATDLVYYSRADADNYGYFGYDGIEIKYNGHTRLSTSTDGSFDIKSEDEVYGLSLDTNGIYIFNNTGGAGHSLTYSTIDGNFSLVNGKIAADSLDIKYAWIDSFKNKPLFTAGITIGTTGVSASYNADLLVSQYYLYTLRPFYAAGFLTAGSFYGNISNYAAASGTNGTPLKIDYGYYDNDSIQFVLGDLTTQFDSVIVIDSFNLVNIYKSVNFQDSIMFNNTGDLTTYLTQGKLYIAKHEGDEGLNDTTIITEKYVKSDSASFYSAYIGNLYAPIIGLSGYDKIQVLADTFDMENVGLLMFPSGTYQFSIIQPPTDNTGSVGSPANNYLRGYIDTIYSVYTGITNAVISSTYSNTYNNASGDTLDLRYNTGTNMYLPWGIRNADDLTDWAIYMDSTTVGASQDRIHIMKYTHFAQPILVDSTLNLTGNFSAIASAESLYWNSTTGDGIVTGDWIVRDTLLIGGYKYYNNASNWLATNSSGYYGTAVWATGRIQTPSFVNISNTPILFDFTYTTYNDSIVGIFSAKRDSIAVIDTFNLWRFRDDVAVDSSLTVVGIADFVKADFSDTITFENVAAAKSYLTKNYLYFRTGTDETPVYTMILTDQYLSIDSINVGGISLDGNAITFSDSLFLTDGTANLYYSPTYGGITSNTAFNSTIGGDIAYLGYDGIGMYQADWDPFAYLTKNEIAIIDSIGGTTFVFEADYDGMASRSVDGNYYMTFTTTDGKLSVSHEIESPIIDVGELQVDSINAAVAGETSLNYFNGVLTIRELYGADDSFKIDMPNNTVYLGGTYIAGSTNNNISSGVYSDGFYSYNMAGDSGYFDLYVSEGVGYLGMYDYATQAEWVTLTPGTFYNMDGTDSLYYTGGDLTISGSFLSHGDIEADSLTGDIKANAAIEKFSMDSLMTVSANAWTTIKFTAGTALRGDSNFYFNADSTAIYFKKAMTVRYSGHMKFTNGSGSTLSATLGARTLQNTTELSCGGEVQQLSMSNGESRSVLWNGVKDFAAGDSIKLQYYVNNTGIDIRPNAILENRRAVMFILQEIK